MAFIWATDFDSIAYMSKMSFFGKLFFFTPVAFLEYDHALLYHVKVYCNDMMYDMVCCCMLCYDTRWYMSRHVVLRHCMSCHYVLLLFFFDIISRK